MKRKKIPGTLLAVLVPCWMLSSNALAQEEGRGAGPQVSLNKAAAQAIPGGAPDARVGAIPPTIKPAQNANPGLVQTVSPDMAKTQTYQGQVKAAFGAPGNEAMGIILENMPGQESGKEGIIIVNNQPGPGSPAAGGEKGIIVVDTQPGGQTDDKGIIVVDSKPTGQTDEKGIIVVNTQPTAHLDEHGIIIINNKPVGKLDEQGIIIVNSKPVGQVDEHGIIIIDSKPVGQLSQD